jgi:hypothetical protein
MHTSRLLPQTLIAACLALTGCSTLTPNQRLHAGVAGYIAADVALTAADAAGKIPDPVKPSIRADITTFAQRLTDAQHWIDNNPALADAPGISPPALDALDIIRAVVRQYILKYALFAPLPSSPPIPPATQPLAAQK